MLRQKVTNQTAPGPRKAVTAVAGTTGYLPDIAVRLCGALLALAISTVHVADQGGITALNSPGWIGWSYRLIEVGGVLTALALLIPWQILLSRSAALSRSRLRPWAAGLGWAAGVLLGLGPFTAYIASRSVGLPGDPGDVGNWGYWVGTVSLFVEAALVVLSLTVLLAMWQSSRVAAARAAKVTHLDLAPSPVESDLRSP
jgi:hypothetical protein